MIACQLIRRTWIICAQLPNKSWKQEASSIGEHSVYADTTCIHVLLFPLFKLNSICTDSFPLTQSFPICKISVKALMEQTRSLFKGFIKSFVLFFAWTSTPPRGQSGELLNKWKESISSSHFDVFVSFFLIECLKSETFLCIIPHTDMG